MQLDSEAKLASNTSMIIAASESGSLAPSPVCLFVRRTNCSVSTQAFVSSNGSWIVFYDPIRAQHKTE